jgi:hypothetical protein
MYFAVTVLALMHDAATRASSVSEVLEETDLPQEFRGSGVVRLGAFGA